MKVDKTRRPMHADDTAVCLTSRSAVCLSCLLYKVHTQSALRDIPLLADSHVNDAMPGEDRLFRPCVLQGFMEVHSHHFLSHFCYINFRFSSFIVPVALPAARLREMVWTKLQKSRCWEK